MLHGVAWLQEMNLSRALELRLAQAQQERAAATTETAVLRAEVQVHQIKLESTEREVRRLKAALEQSVETLEQQQGGAAACAAEVAQANERALRAEVAAREQASGMQYGRLAGRALFLAMSEQSRTQHLRC